LRFLNIYICVICLTLLPVSSGSAQIIGSINGAQTRSANKIAKENEKNARKLHKQAERFAERNDFWQASVNLILIIDFYPNYTKLEDAVFLLAGCFYEMEMYEGADRMYRYLLRSLTGASLVAESIVGLQKVAYQKGEFEQSLKFYKALESHYPSDENLNESRYYASQTYFNLEDYNLVQNIVPHVKKKSEFYPFALYTSGLSFLKKKGVRKAVEKLNELVNMTGGDEERKEVISSGRLTLAYIYFELNDYQKSLDQLSKIPSNFHDYAEALLTRSWNLVKLQDFQAGLSSLNELCEKYSDYYNIEEAYFLRAQCYLKLGYYDFSASEYANVLASKTSDSDTTNATLMGIQLGEQAMTELQKEIDTFEQQLLNTIPLRGMGRAHQLVNQPDLLERARKESMQNIVATRQQYNNVIKSIARLTKRADKEESRKKWEAYAEYGKVRALFLKETAGQ